MIKWQMCLHYSLHVNANIDCQIVKNMSQYEPPQQGIPRAVEIFCPTWSHFIQENFFLLVLGQVQIYKVNTILYFIF